MYSTFNRVYRVHTYLYFDRNMFVCMTRGKSNSFGNQILTVWTFLNCSACIKHLLKKSEIFLKKLTCNHKAKVQANLMGVIWIPPQIPAIWYQLIRCIIEIIHSGRYTQRCAQCLLLLGHISNWHCKNDNTF